MVALEYVGCCWPVRRKVVHRGGWRDFRRTPGPAQHIRMAAMTTGILWQRGSGRSTPSENGWHTTVETPCLARYFPGPPDG